MRRYRCSRYTINAIESCLSRKPNDASDNVWPNSITCESNLDETMTTKAVEDEKFHELRYITFDFYIDVPLMVNLATNTMGG